MQCNIHRLAHQQQHDDVRYQERTCKRIVNTEIYPHYIRQHHVLIKIKFEEMKRGSLNYQELIVHFGEIRWILVSHLVAYRHRSRKRCRGSARRSRGPRTNLYRTGGIPLYYSTALGPADRLRSPPRLRQHFLPTFSLDPSISASHRAVQSHWYSYPITPKKYSLINKIGENFRPR